MDAILLFHLFRMQKLRRTHSNHSGIILMLVAAFLIVSSSTYPTIMSGNQNREMSIMAVALAQVLRSKR